ncbi:META domain-containing protein [Tichowtungia aerotolerans]|uniref:META domain-containing protein n=1 Tax=Tichowtungia aerotolerans TaxID=2697043 RepID=A0A6P1M6B2_9BACT|nr:META domain-containing protein [Tichowtungia aerotolerans]QHI69381.1 META domain-containing protein [Tichowtungia aerotolerans]
MNVFRNGFLAGMVALLLQGCSTIPQNSVYWVRGFKVEGSAGAGKMKSLQVYRGDHLADATWENFHALIAGFDFEPGFLKKIEVKEENLALETLPADTSSIKYTLVQELERLADPCFELEGDWILASISSGPVNRMVKLPTLSLSLNEMRISGSGGCNHYSAAVSRLTDSNIMLGPVAATKRACVNKNIEADYLANLNRVKQYALVDSRLVFSDEKGTELLAFIKKSEPPADPRLHDVWGLLRIAGKTVSPKQGPHLEINLTDKQVFGNDGCNDFRGAIEHAAGSSITLGTIASTRKMCMDMEVPDAFSKALGNMAGKAVSYKISGLTLVFLDADGNELLAFKKAD